MNSQKAGNELNLALDMSENERQKSLDLEVGYSPEEDTWELIVKYTGNLRTIEEELGISIVELLNEYAVIVIPESKIGLLEQYEEIEYIEKPKKLYFTVNRAKEASCINPLQNARYNLFGKGVLVSVIDSGIDYAHSDFRNEDGTSRILELWDQTIPGKPPEGYRTGTVYTREEIDQALAYRDRAEQLRLVPSVDISGHGTHVAGIAAGNGRASGGRYRGVASKSELLIVKLGNSVGDSFPRTTQMIEAIDYSVRRAVELKIPVVINISFGNNYGSHDGMSLIENYINDISNIWKSVIVIGTGNEGDKNHHTSGTLAEGREEEVEFAVAANERNLNLQIWKSYTDEIDIILVHPSGQMIGPVQEILGKQQFKIGDTEIFLYYGEPSPYNSSKEIYFAFIPVYGTIDSGIWKVRLIPRRIVDGRYDMWLPGSEAVQRDTRFLYPTENTTLTIPSTASKVISVGAYNTAYSSYAEFSGRGYTRETNQVKPDLVAPGVGIMSASPGGGYTMRSGTSMAAPFVSGSAAMLMEWGIIEGNDPYLYGEKVKAYLIRGARPLPGFTEYPNPLVGWGALCLRDSLPEG